MDSERFISGKLEYFRNTFQVTHPSHIIKVDDINKIKDDEYLQNMADQAYKDIVESGKYSYKSFSIL